MRVLLAMECTIGGTRRHIVDLCAGLVGRGIDAHLVASALRQPDFEADLLVLEARGARVTRLPMVREPSPAKDAAHLAAIARILERERPDVLHTHSSKAGALGRLASLATGVGARVHTPHTYAFLFDAMFGAAKRRLYFEIERALAGSTRAIVAVGESEARTIRASGVCEPGRVRTVPNGVDAAALRAAVPCSRQELGVPEDAPLFLVAGLLNAAKGQDLAIRALAMRRDARAHLLVVGHGPMEAELRALARAAGVLDRTHFLGWRQDLPRIHGAVDWLVLPSRWEALPYVVLEALAAGTPVVATPVDGAREILAEGACGVLASAVDAASLSSALDKAAAVPAPERKAMGNAGRELVERRYSTRSMIDGVLRVYEEAVS